MRERIDRAIEMAAIEIIPWRGKLAQFVSDVVRQWDTRSFTERLELAVGRDLQYIRITGTLVGGLVDCLLYLLGVTPATSCRTEKWPEPMAPAKFEQGGFTSGRRKGPQTLFPGTSPGNLPR